jgi:hypothetical protein
MSHLVERGCQLRHRSMQVWRLARASGGCSLTISKIMHATPRVQRRTASDNGPASEQRYVKPLSAASTSYFLRGLFKVPRDSQKQQLLVFTNVSNWQLQNSPGRSAQFSGGEMPDVEHIHGSTLKVVGRLMSPLNQDLRLGRPPAFDVHHRRS